MFYNPLRARARHKVVIGVNGTGLTEDGLELLLSDHLIGTDGRAIKPPVDLEDRHLVGHRVLFYLDV